MRDTGLAEAGRGVTKRKKEKLEENLKRRCIITELV